MALTIAVLTVVFAVATSSHFVESSRAANPTSSTKAEQSPSVDEVASELMCVTCRKPLLQSSAKQAIQERNEIERLIAEGKSKSQIVDHMVDIYGPDVLIASPGSTMKRLELFVPIALALLALVIGTVMLRRFKARSIEETAAHSDRN